MNLKESKRGILRFFADHFLYYVVTALCKSLKIEKHNYEAIQKLNSKNQNYVLAFWHGTMLLPWYLHGSPDVVALTSKSKDGDILAKILRKWKFNVVRGSSSTGGDVALDTMVDYAKNKSSIAITPDGPRGPRHQFKAGAVVIAKKATIPLILVGIGLKRKQLLSNWDKFEIPIFFTKAVAIYSEPVFVNSNLTYDEISELISDCEKKLNELQTQAQNYCFN